MNDSLESVASVFGGEPELPIFDPLYKADPLTTLRRLQTEGERVLRVRLPSGVLAWLVTDYEMARTVLADPRFSKHSPQQAHGSGGEHSHPVFHHMLQMDPPEHTRLRALVARNFVPQQMKAHVARIQSICDQLVEALAVRNKIELVAEFAVPLALAAICSIIGIPQSDAWYVQRWTNLLVKADFEDPSQFSLIGEEIHGYFERLLDSRTLRDDTVFGQLAFRVGTGEISRNELFAMAFLLLNAGYETSANFIGNGVFALLRTGRAQWSALCSDPSLVAGAVEELLRFESPLEMATPRFAASAIELAGIRIAKGDMVFAVLAAANRDAAQFFDPDTLDIARPNGPRHLAFGHGIHFCLGAQLARLQGQIALRALTRRLPTLTLDGEKEPPVWQLGLIMRGVSHLHLAHSS